MGYRVTDFLVRLFDADTSTVPGLGGPDPMPEAAGSALLPVTTEPTRGPEPEPLGGDTRPAEAVQPGQPCPKCRGLLWWEDLEGGRHCLDCERAGWERSEEVAARARRLRARSGLPPWGFVFHPAECPRCRSTEVRDVPIHNGLSVRRDCARCGRFIEFVTWYGRVLDPGRN